MERARRPGLLASVRAPRGASLPLIPETTAECQGEQGQVRSGQPGQRRVLTTSMNLTVRHQNHVVLEESLASESYAA